MKRFIVSDIFGRTDALEDLAVLLPGKVEIIDPYGKRSMHFASEADAYKYFMTYVGLAAYKDDLINRVGNATGPVTLLGFSMGASAIWSISDNPHLTNITGALGFYGSQIRAAEMINPLFPIKLIFPRREKHFDVPGLVQVLLKKKSTEITQAQYLHGFMNQHSPNFDSKGYEEYMTQLKSMPADTCFSRMALSDD